MSLVLGLVQIFYGSEIGYVFALFGLGLLLIIRLLRTAVQRQGWRGRIRRAPSERGWAGGSREKSHTLF